MKIIEQLLAELYCGISPYENFDNSVDFGYPHTNLKLPVLDAVIKALQGQNGFYLEFGSMLGGSAILAAEYFKANNINKKIICVDPFCGDVNMWCWEKDLLARKEWRFLKLKNGKSTIYDRFLSNVLYSKNENNILPIQCTSLIGVDLIKRLYKERRITLLPSIIYLDSAHLEGETYLELIKSFSLLPDIGILYGDDWGWDAVRNDVIKFSHEININYENIKLISNFLPNSSIINDKIVVYEGQWIICK
jgi:hypothetical protein